MQESLGRPTAGTTVLITGAAAGGRVDVLVADLSSWSEVRRLAEEVIERLPRL